MNATPWIRPSAIALAVATLFPAVAPANAAVTTFTQIRDAVGGTSLYSIPGPNPTVTTITPFAARSRVDGTGIGEPSGFTTGFGISTQNGFGLQAEARVASRATAFGGGLADNGLTGLAGSGSWTESYTNLTGVTQRATFTYGFSLSMIHQLATGAVGGQGQTQLALVLSAPGSSTPTLTGNLVSVFSSGPEAAGGNLGSAVITNAGNVFESLDIGAPLGLGPDATNAGGFNATSFTVRHSFIDIAPGATQSLFASLNLSLLIGALPGNPGGNCCSGLAPYCLTTQAVMGTREGFWGWSFAPVGGGNGGGGGGNEIPLPATLALAAAGIAGLAAARRRRAR